MKTGPDIGMDEDIVVTATDETIGAALARYGCRTRGQALREFIENGVTKFHPSGSYTGGVSNGRTVTIRRAAALAVVLVFLLAGCASEAPLDSRVGQVAARHFDEGYSQPYSYPCGKSTCWGVTVVDDEWSLAAKWRPQRFRDAETHKVRTQPAYFESGFNVDQGLYDDCRVGDWIEVNTDGDVVGCAATMPENTGGNL